MVKDNMKVSQNFLNTIQKLDMNNDGISYQEIKNLDTNNNGKVDKSEASKEGITNQKDIDQINKNILKYYKGGTENKGRHAPTEIIFPNPSKPLNPEKFTKSEKVFLNSQFKVPIDEKGILPQTSMKLGDLTLSSLSLTTIQKYANEIQKASQKHGVDPKLIAAVIFEEQTHEFPPFEDKICQATEALNIKKCTSFGLGQLGLDEIKIQKIKLPPEETARNYLLKPENNIDLLAGKIKRIQGELGYNQNKTLTLESYHESRAIAKIVYLHNGYPDYPKRILEYMKNPEIINALNPPKLPEPGPRQKPEDKADSEVEVNRINVPSPQPGHRSKYKT